MRMFEQIVERQQPAQHDLGRSRTAVPDVLRAERPVDAPGRDPADAEPGAVPGLFDGVLAAPADEAVGERRIGPADEGEILGAEEHAARQYRGIRRVRRSRSRTVTAPRTGPTAGLSARTRSLL